MKWSFRLGSAFGIPVYVHTTFALLLAWIGYQYWLVSRSIETTIGGIVFLLAIFGCVVLHEFGHALVARRYGIATRDITLLPIGGLARLERMPDEPRQELWVALAGPAVNVAIAAVLFGWLTVTGTGVHLERVGVTGGPIFERLMVVNIILAVFNMIPAFPMDGGRVLRAVIASRMEYSKATGIAAGVGQSLAFVFGLLGLVGNPMLLFIALFVWIGAAQESSLVQMRTALGGIPLRDAMITKFDVLRRASTLGDAVALTLTGAQKDFPVVEEHRVIGILMQKDLLGALSERGRDVAVGEVMQTDFLVLDAGEMLESAFRKLGECACSTAPIAWRGQLVGLVTMDNIGEFLSIQGALRTRRRGR